MGPTWTLVGSTYAWGIYVGSTYFSGANVGVVDIPWKKNVE